MKFWTAVAVAMACVALFGRCAEAECLATAQAVWAAHPKAAHPTWNYNADHTKCWRAGPLSRHVQLHRRGSYGMAAPVPKRLPQRDWLTPDEGARLADYLLPLPNFKERWP